MPASKKSRATTAAKTEQKLTAREEKFCVEYARCLNGTKAAKLAGYSANAATEIACENLRKPHVRARLMDLADLTPEKIINEVVAIATARLVDVVTFSPTEIKVTPSNDLPERAKAGLKSIKFTTTEYKDKTVHQIEVQMHDKNAALDKLMRLFKLYPSDMKILEAVNLLLAEGILSEEQALIVQNGVDEITEKLSGTHRAIATETPALPE